jgi:hypothetical protein
VFFHFLKKKKIRQFAKFRHQKKKKKKNRNSLSQFCWGQLRGIVSENVLKA